MIKINQMRKQFGILFICLVACSFGLHVQKHLTASIYEGRVAIQSDTGKFIARCTKCADYYRFLHNDSAVINGESPQIEPNIWDLTKVGDKVAFKSDNGFYLAVCKKCWRDQHFPQSVFAEVETLNGHPQALWTPEDLGNGKWAFKSYEGKYLTRCNKCTDGKYPDVAFAHAIVPSDSWAQWKLLYQFPPRDLNIQGYNGLYLSRCTNCGNGQYPDSVSLQSLSPDDSRAIWYAEPKGDQQFGFVDEKQNYMSRCTNCWNGVNSDAVFDFVDFNSDKPQTYWTVEWLDGNKWAFKSDNGKYLTICSDCVPGGQFAFATADSPNDPKSQFTVTSRTDYRI